MGATFSHFTLTTTKIFHYLTLWCFKRKITTKKLLSNKNSVLSHNQILCSSLDSVWTCFLLILGHFPLLRHEAEKPKIIKKLEKRVDILLFFNSVPKITIILHLVPKTKCTRAFLSFMAPFSPFHLIVSRKIKIFRK